MYDLWKHKINLSKQQPLIHCINNPISINDCANILLAFHAKPIMASHPKESAEITSQANALSLNLGNFEDTRAQAMFNSAKYAHEHSIPFILDLVGIGCSTIRKEFANTIIHQFHPTIIKGNISELKTLTKYKSHAKGIDVGKEDIEDPEISLKWLQELSKTYQCTILCSGKVDMIASPDKSYLIYNGHEMMSQITGTGCMLTVITAAFLSITNSIEACLCSTCFFEVACQKAIQKANGPGTFHMYLMDEVYQLNQEDIQLFRIEEIK